MMKTWKDSKTGGVSTPMSTEGLENMKNMMSMLSFPFEDLITLYLTLLFSEPHVDWKPTANASQSPKK